VTELLVMDTGCVRGSQKAETQSTSLCPFSPSCAGNAQLGHGTPCNCNWDCAYANEFSVCVFISRIFVANGNVSTGGVDLCRRV
jgi:hypothetical protein